MVRVKKRGSSRSYALLMILLAGLLVVSAFSATQFIKAKRGGTIDVAPGVELVILPGALEMDTVISAGIETGETKTGEEYIGYWFGPDNTVFSKPAKLKVSRKTLIDYEVDDLTLYGEHGEAIVPREKGKRLEYEILHFSLYYYRRR